MGFIDNSYNGGFRLSSILAVGAHPDDIEAGCFGTLIKHLNNEDSMNVVITTSGGLPHRPWNVVEKEIEEAQKFLGIKYKIFNNPNGHYQMNWKTVSEIDEVIDREKVDTVYTVWHGDSHQDHQLTYKVVLAAARKKQVKNFYCFELPDYSYRSERVFVPRRFVDISEHMESKVKAVAAFKSYFSESNIDAMIGLARHRGGAIGVKYAEAFEIIFEMWK